MDAERAKLRKERELAQKKMATTQILKKQQEDEIHVDLDEEIDFNR